MRKFAGISETTIACFLSIKLLRIAPTQKTGCISAYCQYPFFCHPSDFVVLANSTSRFISKTKWPPKLDFSLILVAWQNDFATNGSDIFFSSQSRFRPWHLRQWFQCTRYARCYARCSDCCEAGLQHSWNWLGQAEYIRCRQRIARKRNTGSRVMSHDKF